MKMSESSSNAVGKEEIATVFSKDLYCRQLKTLGLFGKGLTHFPHNDTPGKQAF